MSKSRHGLLYASSWRKWRGWFLAIPKEPRGISFPSYEGQRGTQQRRYARFLQNCTCWRNVTESRVKVCRGRVDPLEKFKGFQAPVIRLPDHMRHELFSLERERANGGNVGNWSKKWSAKLESHRVIHRNDYGNCFNGFHSDGCGTFLIGCTWTIMKLSRRVTFEQSKSIIARSDLYKFFERNIFWEFIDWLIICEIRAFVIVFVDKFYSEQFRKVSEI